MCCRNEDWVVGISLRAALIWNDSAVVLMHACTDGTASIVAEVEKEYPGRVIAVEVSDPAWKEMEHRQLALQTARALGATHMTVADADEILCGDLLPCIRGQIEGLKAGTFLGIPMKNLHRSILQYRADHSPFGSMSGTMLAFADAPHLGWSAKGGYDHHSRAPHGATMRKAGILKTESGLMHLQFANWRRLVAKQKAYRVLERIKYPAKPVSQIEALYSLSTDERGLKLRTVPDQWWEPYVHLLQYLDLDRAPWQESYVSEMIAAHDPSYFNGLRVSEGQIG